MFVLKNETRSPAGIRFADFSSSSYSYDANANRFSRGQCTWYVYGRIHEKLGINLQSSGSMNGGLWVKNIIPKSEGGYGRIETDINKIQENSAASYMYESQASSGSRGYYGHIIFIELVERDQYGNPTYVYYSEANANGDGKVSSDDGQFKKLSFTDFKKLFQNRTPQPGEPIFQGYIQF